MYKVQWDFLKKIAEEGNVPQCMIFSGMKHLNKKETAQNFVKLLNCQVDDFQKKPCGKCFSCKLIERKKHPDIIFISPEKKEIQIFQIRRLKEQLSLSPQLSDFKSVIINQAETLNSEAQNSLLKTLEEPKGKTLIILIVTRPEILFETIRSRCHILRFYPDSFFFPESENFRRIEEIFCSSTSQRISFCQKFFKGETPFDNIESFLDAFENYLRMVFLKELKVNIDELGKFSYRIPENYNLLKIKKAIENLGEFRLLISTTNINQRLALENLMLNI